MKISILLFAYFFFCPTFSLYSQEEGDSAAYKSYRWFINQRNVPDDTIPPNAYLNAINEKENLNPQGFDIQNPWVNIGPAPFLSSGANLTGRVTAAVFADAYTIFIGGAQGGVWKGTNFSGNVHWADLSYGLSSLSSGAIAAYNNGISYTIYYGSGESINGFVYTYSGLGIFKSV